MFSNLFKLIFVITAYSPIFLIVGLIEIYNCIKNNNTLIFISKFGELFSRINFIWVFIILLFSCVMLMNLANNKLTINNISVKSIKSADFNITAILLSYFLPCIELFKKDFIFQISWMILLFVVILINKNTYFYNPVLKILGYRYYEIATKKEVSYIMLSKVKLINQKQITTYIQLTDYVILNKK